MITHQLLSKGLSNLAFREDESEEDEDEEVDNGETDEDSEETDQGDGTKAVVIID